MTKSKKKVAEKKTTKKKVVDKKISEKRQVKVKIKKKTSKMKSSVVQKKANKKAAPKKPTLKKVKEKVEKKIMIKRKKIEKKTDIKKTQKSPKIVEQVQSEKEFEEIERMLLNQRAELLKLISKSSTWEKDISKLERGDLQDMAATSLEREMTFVIGSREREEFRMINNALKKMVSKTYGICENCGEKINIKRLKIVPFAPFCIECKSSIEQEVEADRENLF